MSDDQSQMEELPAEDQMTQPHLNEQESLHPNFPDDSQWMLSARKLDLGIYHAEQMIVTFCALAMTTVICLDIFYRILVSQNSEPLRAALTLSAPDPDLDVSIGRFVFALITPLVVGWGAYMSQHRGEESAQKKGFKIGGYALVASYFLAVAIRMLPSWLICQSITIVAGVGCAVSLWRSGRKRTTIALVLGCLPLLYYEQFLPQNYIWGQELSLILLAWLAFLGASMATYQNKHIKISALAGLIPTKYKSKIRPVSLVITAIFSFYIQVLLFDNIFGDKGSFWGGEIRPATHIPAWTILASGVVAFSLITIRSLGYASYAFKHPTRQPKEGGTH